MWGRGGVFERVGVWVLGFGGWGEEGQAEGVVEEEGGCVYAGDWGEVGGVEVGEEGGDGLGWGGWRGGEGAGVGGAGAGEVDFFFQRVAVVATGGFGVRVVWCAEDFGQAEFGC